MDYFQWAVSTVTRFAGTDTGVFPYVFVVDESNKVIYASNGWVDLYDVCESCFGITESDIATVSVRGYVDSQAGREIMRLVNQERARVGVGQLVWDADLEATAIQRAAETAIFYSHTRPDGTACTTAMPPWAEYNGENTAYGLDDAAGVNEAWTNSPGHYANMINPGFVSFASAMFESPDGTRYWVEVFSGSDIQAADISVEPQLTYTGSELRPAPVVTYDGTTLVEGGDCAVSYKDNIEVGHATVEVQGIGRYTGVLRTWFEILPDGE